MTTMLRASKFFLWVLLFLVFPASAEVHRNQAVGIEFPDAVGGMVRNPEIFDYEKFVPGLGESVAYNAEGVKSTIYIYRIGQNVKTDEVGSVRLKDHFHAAIGDVVKMQSAGQYQNLVLLEAGDFFWGDKLEPTKSLYAKLSYQQNSVDLISYVHVLGYRGQVLKVRHTFDSEVSQKGEEMQKNLLQMIGRQLTETDQ
jgi:hypothetical protein